MRNAALLLLLILAVPVRESCGEPFVAGQSLNPALIAQVVTTAFDFMAPRTLEPVPLPQLALWGLRGLTAIDPRLTPDVQIEGGRATMLRLIGPSRVLLSRPAPGETDAAGWGEAVAQSVLAAWDSSEPVRRAGQAEVIRSFFDEVFNHFDPYSRYASPAEAQADQTRRMGRAEVGIRSAVRGGQVHVETVLPGSPAAQAGVRPGERIVAIDGEPTQGADARAVTALLAGPEQSGVSLSLRGRDGRVRIVVLTREALPQETVTATRRDGVLVLRLSGFVRNTASRLAQELIAGIDPAAPPLGVVIDLRGNRGGLLRQAVAAAAMLQPTGLVAITAGRAPEAAHMFRAEGRDLAEGLPVVLVVDGRSASAAEVLAAALADHGRAVVIGSTTLGKGLVQTLTRLPDGGELYVTWSRLLAPRGWPLQGLGVVPQLCTSLGQDALSRQLEALGRGVQPMQPGLARHRAARAPMAAAEMLEIRAVCPAAEGRDLDLAAARHLIVTPAAYAAALFGKPPPSPSPGATIRRTAVVGGSGAAQGVPASPGGLTGAPALRN